MDRYIDPNRVFDVIIITPTGKKSEDGYLTALCSGYNRHKKEELHHLGVIDSFKDTECKFDFYKDGKSVAVFNNSVGTHRVYMPNSFTGNFIAL